MPILFEMLVTMANKAAIEKQLMEMGFSGRYTSLFASFTIDDCNDEESKQLLLFAIKAKNDNNVKSFSLSWKDK